MSFSSDVKAELCRAEFGAKACAVAECYGVLLFCNAFGVGGIRVITGSRDFAARLPKLFRRAFGFDFDDAGETEIVQSKQVLRITDAAKTGRILEAFGCEASGVVAHHLNLGVLEEEGCRESFLRGAFLAGGSVTDPAKRYHLEFVTAHCLVSREATALFMDMGFEPKLASRGGSYMIYFKQSSAIEDLLTTMGAPVAAMGVMSAKIEKGMTNSVNRQVNCDTANVLKTVEAAGGQLAAIKAIREGVGLGALPEKLRETAMLREANPELSMAELAAACDPPVTKSCLSHRLRRLVEIAEENKRG